MFIVVRNVHEMTEESIMGGCSIDVLNGGTGLFMWFYNNRLKKLYIYIKSMKIV